MPGLAWIEVILDADPVDFDGQCLAAWLDPCSPYVTDYRREEL